LKKKDFSAKEVKVEKKEEKKPEKEEKKVETISKESKLDSKDTLVPLEMYIKAGSYIGTKVITPDMRKYVYRRRNDGIAIINTNLIDEKLKEAIRFLNKFRPEDWVLVCKREAGWRAAKLFSELTGVRVFTKKYPAGIITNISLPNFFETEMIFICDPWLDKNALNDAVNVKREVMGICDTNNLTKGVNVVVPANNKGNKSLGLILWIVAREYMHARGINKELPNLEEFIGEKLEELPLKEKKKEKAREEEKKKDEAKIEAIMKDDDKKE
jgi:small subunit ribosomal protein S2